jgi:hypothetical protein
VNHLFTQTSRQNLASSRFFYRVRAAHLFSFPYCVYYYFACLSGITNGAGYTQPSGAPEFTTSFSGIRVTRYTNSDEPFCIFKLFSVLYTIYKVYILHYPIALLKAYILMIGLYMFTNNIQ